MSKYLIDADMLGPDFSGGRSDLSDFVDILAERGGEPRERFAVASHVRQPGTWEPSDGDWMEAIQAFAEQRPDLFGGEA